MGLLAWCFLACFKYKCLSVRSHFGKKAESLFGNHQQLVTIVIMDPMEAIQADVKWNNAQARTRKAEELVKKAGDCTSCSNAPHV